MKYNAGRSSSTRHVRTPLPRDIVRRVLATGRIADALYVRGPEEPGSKSVLGVSRNTYFIRENPTTTHFGPVSANKGRSTR